MKVVARFIHPQNKDRRNRATSPFDLAEINRAFPVRYYPGWGGSKKKINGFGTLP